MKKLIGNLCFLTISLSLFSQSVLVTDETTLQPMAGVEIFSHIPGVSAITNQDGIADFSPFKNADTIYFNHVGYQKLTYSYKQLENLKFSVFMVPRAYDLNTLVVSASRFEEKMTDVPQQIQVLNARQLEFMNQQTTADVIQHSGNISVQKSQLGGGSPIIRGFEANKVLLVVDGVRMNNAIFRGGHLQNIISMDNSMLEKTEIVFGPGSVIYGSDALGGVIHFYTRDPQLAVDGKTNVKAGAFARYSSAFNEKTGHADFNIGLKKVASFTSFTYSDFGDLRQGSVRNPFYGDWGKRLYYADRIDERDTTLANSDYNIQKQSGYKQYDLLEKVLFKPNKNVSHILNFQFSTSSDIPRYDRLTEMGSSGNMKYAEWYYGPQNRMFLAYKLEIDEKNELYDMANITLAYQNIEESRHNRRFGNNSLRNQMEKVGVFTLNADLSKMIGQNELRYGIEATYNDVNSTANSENIVTGETTPAVTRYPDGGSNMKTFAVYLTHTLEITPKLILSEGLRYNYISLYSKFIDKAFFPFPFNDVTQNSGALNGKIGLVAMPCHSWRFSVLGSTGFRAPNVDDMGKVFDSSPGTVIVPNPDLKPEYTYNGEFSITKVFEEKIKVEGIAYYTIYNNIITAQRSTFNGQDSIVYDGELSAVITSKNAEKAYIYGFSGNLSAEITKAFSIESTLNYTFGRIKTDTVDYPLDHIPPVFGKTSFNLNIKKFRGEFFVEYAGWKRLKDYNLVGEDNIQYATEYGMPAWYTLNVRVAYQFNRILQIQLAAENLTDQNYRVFASGISAPGRNLALTLRARL